MPFHADEADGFVAVHWGEERATRLRQRWIVNDQSRSGAPDLLLVNRG